MNDHNPDIDAMNALTPEQMAEIMDNLHLEPTDAQIAPDTTADSKPGLKPRSIKMSDDLDTRVQLRAASLGLSKSAYFRWLAEKDLRAAYSEGADTSPLPELVSLEDARRAMRAAVDVAFRQLEQHRGNAA